MSRSLNRGRPHTSHPALADKPGVPGWSGRAHRPVRSSTGIARADAHLGLVLPGLDLGARDACAHTAQARNIGPCVATNYPTPEKKIAGFTDRDKPGCRFARAQADPGPVFGPERAVGSTTCGHLPKFVARRVRSRLPPPPPSPPRCSHSGIARGQLRVFLRVSGDCSGSREGAEEDEARPRQSGGQCAEDRLANRVSWSGFRGIRRQRRTTVRAAQPRAVDRKSLRLRESASQVSRSYPVLSRVQNF